MYRNTACAELSVTGHRCAFPEFGLGTTPQVDLRRVAA